MTDTQPKKSDLGVRVASAIVMVAVAGTALWLGGWAWTAFVAVVALGVLWEWWNLVLCLAQSVAARATWMLSGLLYLFLAATVLITLRGSLDPGVKVLLSTLLGVIGTDIGAYFVGRMLGGPKIAPSISPSKTWSGLVGGILGASAMVLLVSWAWASGLCEAVVLKETGQRVGTFGFDGPCSWAALPPANLLTQQVAFAGTVIAVVAQAGDFFESWMKRRAGVKDSGVMIPGHGGLFDRVDGLLAVLLLVSIPLVVDFVR